jgi:tRNA A37 threonylcarbamoyladenosine synthetase subunit TsaC/SUA5/YrdC
VRYLAEAVAVYLDGGPCRGGIPSTVVTFDEGELHIVRAGPIGEDALRQALS